MSKMLKNMKFSSFLLKFFFTNKFYFEELKILKKILLIREKTIDLELNINCSKKQKQENQYSDNL
jgi:hypothetical protein